METRQQLTTNSKDCKNTFWIDITGGTKQRNEFIARPEVSRELRKASTRIPSNLQNAPVIGWQKIFKVLNN